MELARLYCEEDCGIHPRERITRFCPRKNRYMYSLDDISRSRIMNESLSLIKCYLSKLIQVYKISSLDMKNSYCTPMWSSLQFFPTSFANPKISTHLRRDQDGCLNHGGLFYDAFISTLLQLNLLPPPRARPPSPEIWPRPPNHPSWPPSSLREFFPAAWHSKGLTDSHL